MAHTSLTREDKTYFYMLNGRRFWTKDGEEIIVKKFSEEKVSMGVLAKEFETTIGSIAGLLSRARERKLLGPATQRKPKQVSEKKAPDKKIKLDPITLKLNKSRQEEPITRVRLKIVDAPTAVTLEELKSHQCKYPLGDPRQSDFRFCGKDKEGNQPYCSEHCDIVYQKSRR